MKFEELHASIPYVIGGKEKVLRMHPYEGIELRMPGRHAKETTPPGGDFVVCVTDEYQGWKVHQFKHDDIFLLFETRAAIDSGAAAITMSRYAQVVTGADPMSIAIQEPVTLSSISERTLLCALQALAVAEHRRYAQHESRGGGRFLPARFAAGIVEGKWTAAEAMAVQRRGRPGLDQLVNERGAPKTIRQWKELEEELEKI